MTAMSPLVHRRSLLAAATVLPLVACGAAPPADPSLQQSAGRAGMFFGAAVQADQLGGDRDLRDHITQECGIITPELELKWAFIEKARGQLDLSAADRLASFAATHGKVMHGHTLLWHQSIAPWAADALGDNPDWTIVNRFLASIIPRYGAVIGTWDVINEPIEADQPDGLRPSPYLRAFGPDYVVRALEDAALFAPSAKFFINEYGTDYALPDDERKRGALLQLIERVKKSGAPLHGVGLQSHLDLAKQASFDPEVLARFLNELGGMGLEIRISELDVREADPRLPVEKRDQAVADATRAFLDVALANRAVGSVTTWGLSDRYSWLPAPPSPAGLNRGLPLDSDLRRKPMYAAIAAALKDRAA